MGEGQEGESSAGSLKYLLLDLPQDHPQNQNRTVLFLLPGEKVRLRADQNTISFFSPKGVLTATSNVSAS
jgi:hypothetical protein